MKHFFKNKIFRVCALSLSAFFVLCAAYIFGVDAYVVLSTEDRIIDVSEASALEDVDCIIVLGCKVQSDGTPSHMLEDRVLTGVNIYGKMCEKGNGTKLLMSGDHGTAEYNEVFAMKQFAIGLGIDSGEIFMDHAGFSTYESIYRAKEIFGAKKIVIVTQKYHLHRALHIAEALGVEAYGVTADLRTYRGQSMRDLREILARNKDFLMSVFKPKPTYSGDHISLDGSGDVTNDY